MVMEMRADVWELCDGYNNKLLELMEIAIRADDDVFTVRDRR